MLNYAVVGLNLGMEHVDAILKNPRAGLVACCDVDDSKFEKVREAVAVSGQSPGKVIFTMEYDDILKLEDVAAVLIALPTKLHAEFSTRAMRAGKHVFCEKPMADSIENCLAICKAAKESGKVFQLGYTVRSSAFNRKMVEIISGGTIGEPVLVWYNMFCQHQNSSWRADRKSQGGKLFDCACHYLDIISGWAGAKAERVCAFGNPVGQKGPNAEHLPDVANIIIEYENGVKGTFNLSQVSPNLQNSTCGIAGTNGKIEADPYHPEGAGSMNIHSDGGLFKGAITISAAMTSCGHLGFNEQHDVFIDAIAKGTPSACSAEEGLNVARLMAAIDKSIAEGRVVRLDEIPQ